MVLFLFVVMLLNVKEEEQRHIKRTGAVLGVLTVLVIYTLLIRTFGALTSNANAAAPQLDGGTADLGRVLFTDYLLPFEIVSVLLLVAMVGVILLSKKELK
jgi:NADH-quinone oxidoreductase subunit J